MAVIKSENNGGMKYFAYKQGYWFDKSVKEGEDDYSEKTLKDKDKQDVVVGGQFEKNIAGIVTGVNIKHIDADGKKFSVLEVDIDNTERLSMGLESPAAHAVMETFVNVDFTKPVSMLAWQDKAGYNKLSIKQDGEHVKNYFVEFKKDADGKMKPTFQNGYPENPAKDATQTQKTIARAQKQEFLENHFTEKVVPLVPKNVADEQPVDVDPDSLDFEFE